MQYMVYFSYMDTDSVEYANRLTGERYSLQKTDQASRSSVAYLIKPNARKPMKITMTFNCQLS